MMSSSLLVYFAALNVCRGTFLQSADQHLQADCIE